MKKTFLKILVLCMLICSALCVFTACDGNDSGISGEGSYNNTYYLYKNGEYDETNYLKIKGNEWEILQTLNGVSFPLISGTYSITDWAIEFYASEGGETAKLYSGTIKEGVLIIGNDIYCAKGYNENGKINNTNNGNSNGGTNTNNDIDNPSENNGNDNPSGGENNQQSIYYTVSFNSNGGSSVSSQSIAKNNKITKPQNPTKTGYIFAGWYINSSLTVEWDFTNNTVTSGMTLYAKWEEDNSNNNHQHKYGDFVYNESEHWKECVDCEEIQEKEEHKYSEGICSVCGYLQSTSSEFFDFVFIESADGYSVKSNSQTPSNGLKKIILNREKMRCLCVRS